MTEQLMLEKLQTERMRYQKNIETMKTMFFTRISIFNVIYAGLLILAVWVGTKIG